MVFYLKVLYVAESACFLAGYVLVEFGRGHGLVLSVGDQEIGRLKTYHGVHLSALADGLYGTGHITDHEVLGFPVVFFGR